MGSSGTTRTTCRRKSWAGVAGFRSLMQSIKGRGDKCLVFVNYNVMDSCTDWYKAELKPYTHQDTFGNTPNWMAWGESTLTARLGLSVRRHLLGSVVAPLEKVLEDKFVQLVKDGAPGFQVDKVVVNTALDFNPLNTLKPDVALCEGLVQSMARVFGKCKAIDPEFCVAAEALQDRLIPYVDVYYRAAGGFDIAPLRYVFPEWTSCLHVASPYEFNGVNSAVMTGAVICVEPGSYQESLGSAAYKQLGDYIREVQRIRGALADTIFLGEYLDMQGAFVQEVKENAGTGPKYTPSTSGALLYRVHRNPKTGQRAIVVANTWRDERKYLWGVPGEDGVSAEVHAPFEPVKTVSSADALSIPAERVQVLVLPGGAGFAGVETRRGVRDRGERGRARVGGVRRGGAGRFPERVGAVLVAAGVQFAAPARRKCGSTSRAPKGSVGTLRLYLVDQDRFYGGREEEVFVDGQSLGTVSDFQVGKWVECAVSAAMTEDGVVPVVVKNKKGEGNCVISRVAWVGAGE